MINKDITTITDNNLCFSCGACSVVCHADCIDFHISNSGRLIPRIDYNKCTNCGVCFNICPGIDEKYHINKKEDIFYGYGNVINAYLGRSNDKVIFKNSQSGGMVTEVLSYMFDKDLIQYALVVTMDYSTYPKPKYCLVNSKKELISAQKSIYLPINILEAFENIKEIDGDIAVVGVGCQIQGIEELKKYKPKIYSKIKYKLGLICDRTLSYLTNYFFYTNEEYKIIYRDKNTPNYINANVVLETKNKNRKVIDRQIRFLLKNYLTPSRCFICADKMNLNADFVFGDPWGIDGYDKEEGDSIVITRNQRADSIIQEILKERRAKLVKINYEDVLKGQQIEKKKENVFKSLAIYKKYGYEIPSYFKDYELSSKIDKNLEKQIVSFWKMENNTPKNNVKRIKKEINKVLLKQKIKQFLKKILRIKNGN
jgi:coenzyme F420 hydrogenase subunit beta